MMYRIQIKILINIKINCTHKNIKKLCFILSLATNIIIYQFAINIDIYNLWLIN